MTDTYERERDNESLSKDKILSALKMRGITDLAVGYYPTVGSTNTEAKSLADRRTPALLVAEGQTGGRGRMGKSFTCPPGAGVYMSILVYPDMPARDCAWLTASAAVGVARAVENLGITPWIKWVNDLYVGERKLCGILTEGSANIENGRLSYAVIGIGLNVHRSDLGIVSDIATSLEEEGVESPSRAELIAAITAELLTLLSTLDKERIRREYTARLGAGEIPVRVTRGTESYHATALGVDGKLRLHIRRADGTEELLSSADVSVHPEIYDN